MKGEYPNPTMSHCPRLWQNPFYVKHWIDFWDNVVCFWDYVQRSPLSIDVSSW